MDTKWFESRTLWASFLTVIAGVLSASGAVEIPSDAPDKAAGAIITVIGIVMAILRADTSTPIAGTPKSKK